MHKVARISKRLAAQKNVQKTVQKIRYKAGIYARLSSDQDTEKNESVNVQTAIAEKYVEDWNRKHTEQITVADRYIDLGKTGSNFNRDEFQRLMQDIRLGIINCVIVKDLSRFGRNYLEVGNYIEKIFPFLGVRFIAVTDGLDTGDRGGGTEQRSAAMAMEIKNLVNDMYAKDFSVKAKQNLKQRREAGSYVGGPPPYGYLTGREGKIRVLLPDENTAELVRYMFERFIQSESFAAVADDLNSRKINPPAVYKKTGEVFWSADMGLYRGWDKGAVERIIKSRTYTGMLVQGKTSVTARDESNRIHNPEEDWVITENAHEPLIGMEVFRQAEQIYRKER
ncbi:MAG: recombinase family protein [Clostridiales bacterium]|nr:recombinase family protein [Clostridiales bacterium]